MQHDILTRAMAAYYRSGGTDQPANTSGERVLGERRYVVLENVGGVLACYRVRHNGMLRRLRRWPKVLDV